MKCKAVIFDLDGTLLDTLDDLADSMNSVLAAMSLPLIPLNEYKILVGRGMRNLVTTSLPPELRSEELIDRCYSAMFEEYGRRWCIKTRPYDGIPELLDGLAVKEIPAAILSNKVDKITQLVVKKYLAGWKFEAVLGEREGVPRKPDPAGLLEIAGLMRIPADEIICLGDSGSDMTAALGAGMYPVGALWGFRSRSELVGHGAKKVIETPTELLAII